MKGKEGSTTQAMISRRVNKGRFWKPEEDLVLKKYVDTHGEGNWTAVSKRSGLLRSAKSCRLRWKNYLRPNIKRGMMSQDEKDLIIRLHNLLGNRWSLIAGRLPGRTDNEVKNYWNTHLNKRSRFSTTGTATSTSHEITHLSNSQTREKQHSSSQTEQEHHHEKSKEGEIRDSHVNVIDYSWVEHLKDVDCGMTLPLLLPTEPHIPPLFLDNDDKTFMDNLVFLEEAFGTSGDEMLMQGSLFM